MAVPMHPARLPAAWQVPRPRGRGPLEAHGNDRRRGRATAGNPYTGQAAGPDVGVVVVEKGRRERLYTLSEIDNMAMPQIGRVRFLLEDVILLMLYADPRRPIKGKSRILLQAYLALSEIFPESDTEPVRFVHRESGPYSEDVLRTIDNLSFTSNVAVEGESIRSCRLGITPKGRRRIAGMFDALPSRTREKLAQKRREWDALTPAGLRRHADARGPEPPGRAGF